ncbi:aspartate aminotransferase family protein [Sedimentisphaera salicampi]|uniref:aspartate aminotransferase family protein n=1 Tax=Sedimentisphaera salicampi TaxID=1941349 RepID=UPI000B9B1EB4|nr:aspartate aminotransferase family protein [Sedimentisphaera salicampi]OXU14298.1 Acetylornithine aminotransferase [Sedimentisphaera salicampi]
MDTQEVLELFDKYVIANYGRVRKVIVKGEGNWLYDSEGNKILDMFPGWAVSGIGHCHPKVTSAIKSQADKLLHIDNTFYTEQQGRLAELISTKSFGGKCFFCNSGAEANEAALKLARLATSKDKYKVITTLNSFHGRTFAAVSATGQPKHHKGFLPLLPGFKYVPFNDIESLEETFDEETAAILVEPIQGEGGINPATEEYMLKIRELCTAHGAVMILDEVQTGMGRTGEWFGYQHYGIEPDVITLAKALGGGVAIGAIAARSEVAASLVPGTHASTFGGNSLACAASIAVFEAIEEEGLLENARKMGEYAAEKLTDIAEKYSVIQAVRGKGLMIGIQFSAQCSELVNICLEKGLRINCTQGNVIRFMPSMTASKENIDEALKIFEQGLGEFIKDSEDAD